MKSDKAAVLYMGLILTALLAGCKTAPSEPVKVTVSAVPAHTAAPTFTPAPVPTAVPTATPRPDFLAYGEESGFALEVQERLYTLGYLQEEDMTGVCGEETQTAFRKFLWQRDPQAQETSEAGFEKASLDALFADDAPAYDEFVHLAPTTRMEFAELVGDNGDWALPLGYPEAGTYYIVVDIAHQVTMVYTRDEAGDYTVPVRYMLCSTGLGNRTPTGTFDMGAYRLRFSRFDRDGRYGQYWTQIRRAIYFHTILYTQRTAASYQASTFLELGEKASHGCIRLTVPDARWMWYHIAPGTKCLIRQGDKNDAETAAIREKLVLAQPPKEQLALIPGQIPSTDNYDYLTLPHDEPFVQGSQNGG